MNSNEQNATKAIYFSIVSNTFIAIIKWIAGFFGNSYALIADAIESTTDILSSILVLFGIKYSSKPADKNHPYGHGRIEPLITFLVVGFLISSAIIIAINSIENISQPHKTPRYFTLFVLAAIIIWKEISFQYVMKKGKQTNSSTIKADAWHHRSDAMTSIAAFIGISIALIMGKGYESADDWAALVAAGFILFNCYKIFRPALGEIMDEHLYDDLIEQITSTVKKIDGVIDTEKCFVRKTGMKYHVDLHAVVDGNLSVKEGHNIAGKIKYVLMEKIPEICHVLVHIEPEN